jgi:transposase
LCWKDCAARRNISELCRREGIAASMYYDWSKEFLEAGERRLAGDTARAATSGEVKDLRRGVAALKEVVADLTLENRLLKKSMSGDGEGEARDPRRPRSSSLSSNRICRPSAPWTNSATPAPPSPAPPPRDGLAGLRAAAQPRRAMA